MADRSSKGISEHKAPFAHQHEEMKELGDIVRAIKPTCLIGAAAVPRVFTPEIIQDMASFNKQPIIFALSNPTSMAECTAEEAYIHSEGRAVFASGSPFPTFTGFGKVFIIPYWMAPPALYYDRPTSRVRGTTPTFSPEPPLPSSLPAFTTYPTLSSCPQPRAWLTW